MRFKALAVVAAFAAPLSVATPASATQVEIAAQNPVIELGVTEIVRTDPDVATINAGVQTRAATASAALQQNAAQMDQLIKRMEALGIKREDIQTANFNLNPQYNYNRPDGSPPEFVGYDVNNNVMVKLRDMDRIGRVLDELVQAGATNLYGPNFMLEDDVEAKEIARKNAFEKSRKRAEEYAQMAGYSGVRILSISENVTSYGAMPAPMTRTVSLESADVSTPIAIGQVATSATIMIKYEMTQ